MEKSHIKRWNDVARQFLGDDFFAGFTSGAEEAGSGGEEKEGPPADVYHHEDEVIVLVDLPGVENIQDLEMRVSDGNLRLKGKLGMPYKGYEIKSRERQTGGFEKIIPLEENVSNRYTTAKYRKGVLELRFPILKKATPKKVRLRNN